MVVVRFDDVSNPKRPKPLANLVNFSLHPEFLEGNDLISADYIGPLERMVDRATEGLTIFTQNAVGTSEPERSSFHSIHERLEFTHRDYAQAEYGARLMADSIVDTWRDVARRTPEDPSRFVAFDTDFPVGMEDRWFPGPLSHPYPGVSNCRTDKAFQGDPQSPVVGLPDCMGPSALFREAGLDSPIKPSNLPVDPGVSTDTLQEHGIPVPENYSAPGYTGLEEDVSVHLQAFRLGDMLFTVCSCEQWFDQSRNIETRTDRTTGNMHLGYDWSERCTDNGDGTWTCPNPGNPSQSLPPIGDKELQRMRAQVRNDAAGWNSLEYLPYAESEPTDPKDIKGNYTHEELEPELGYRLTVPIGMANDYNGYIATYREYQRGDHYRKALTAWGPHSSDYMASRLVALGGVLNGGDEADLMPEDHGEEKVAADLALNDRRAELLGEIGTGGVAAYEATLPDDAGPVVAVEQPEDVERFGAAFFTWTGGSNYTDNPDVRVQRRSGGRWTDFADQSGEIPVTVDYPDPGEPWRWTAHFEAFAAPFDTGSGTATPAGTYRFVVDGNRRAGGAAEPYEIASEEFEVKPWSGITADDVRVETDGAVSFAVGPRRTVDAFDMDDGDAPPLKVSLGPIDYPDSYESPTRFIAHKRWFKRDPSARDDASRFEHYCFTCSFRPWKDTGDAETAQVTVLRGNRRLRLRAVRSGDRWRTTSALRAGDQAFVAAGDVRDGFGNFNRTGGVRRPPRHQPAVARAAAAAADRDRRAARPGTRL
jgi:hypothetical protein